MNNEALKLLPHLQLPVCTSVTLFSISIAKFLNDLQYCEILEFANFNLVLGKHSNSLRPISSQENKHTGDRNKFEPACMGFRHQFSVPVCTQDPQRG